MEKRLSEVIFHSDTPTGRRFDLAMIAMICLSIVVVMLDSIDDVRNRHEQSLSILEWTFTVLFSAEYALRIRYAQQPWLYMRSFSGIVDLLSILPSYITLFFPGAQYTAVVRALRLLRIFRVLKLSVYSSEAAILVTALTNSRRKITVFLFTVLMLVVICGTLMYVIEDKASGFTSIPRSMYWAIVTLTTVGYGDIAPASAFGQFVAAVMMIIGYGIIAVPIGIYGVEVVKAMQQANRRNDACIHCGGIGHESDARFCKYCGHDLPI